MPNGDPKETNSRRDRSEEPDQKRPDEKRDRDSGSPEKSIGAGRESNPHDTLPNAPDTNRRGVP